MMRNPQTSVHADDQFETSRYTVRIMSTEDRSVESTANLEVG